MAISRPTGIDLIDLGRYPLLDRNAMAYRSLIDATRVKLQTLGVCELNDFITPSGLVALLEDAHQALPLSYRSEGYGTAYDEIIDHSFPTDHPRQALGRFSLKLIAYDQIPDYSPLRSLYELDCLKALVSDALELKALYRYADKLGALNLTFMEAGDEFHWHFDYTDFVVSLAIQSADIGGAFELCPYIRSIGNERYAAVKTALTGQLEGVTRLVMQPGTLILFKGRLSLHRVTPVLGRKCRIVALLGYDECADTTSTTEQRVNRYGRY